MLMECQFLIVTIEALCDMVSLTFKIIVGITKD